MRKAWISAALAPALALLAGPLWAQQRTPTTVVACSGTFAKDSSHLELTTAFNSKNVTLVDVEAADGTKVPASILFPNDPKRRLEVWWSDRTHRSDIHLIVIGGSQPGPRRMACGSARLWSKWKRSITNRSSSGVSKRTASRP